MKKRLAKIEITSATDFQHPAFRALVAVSIGAIAAAYCLTQMKHIATGAAGDFTWHWLAARALLEGKSPYDVVTLGGQYNLNAPYLYPLPSALVAIPFSGWLSPANANVLLAGSSAALMSWGLTRENYQRLPVFLSLPFVWASQTGQYSPLLFAGALIPALGWVFPIKPTLGLSALIYKPSKFAIVGAVALCTLTFVVSPHWYEEWRRTLGERTIGKYLSPLMITGGPLMLLAIFRWKRPEARLLLVLSLVPQLFLFYDQLLLWLIPKTWKESICLSSSSWLALLIGNRLLVSDSETQVVAATYAPVILLMLFLPCLGMVLVRPNQRTTDQHQ